MKDFVKMVLAVICGLFLMGIIGFILLTGFIGALAAAAGSSSKPVLPRSGVLFIDGTTLALAEQSQEMDPMSMLQGGSMVKPIGLWDAVQAINAAAADESVKYIYMKPEGITGGISQLEELRQALSNFRKSGKAIVSYLEFPTTGSYYLASVSDKIYMSANTGAGSQITGIGTQMFFLKDLLDKVGVNVQLIRHGKYKSAGEMYIKNAPSPENLEQNQVMISSIWDSYASEIAESRGLTAERLSQMIDNLELNLPEDMVQDSLVDQLMTKQELKDKLADLAVEKTYKNVKFISFPDYVAAKVTPNLKAKNKIAVIFAEGNIVEGDDTQDIAGDRFVSVISDIRADSTVKAVVLRVASPGGSVLAADKIKTEIDLLRKEKPVIASYGDYAASGGYWISNSCDKIFTDKTTLTGSIGVFGMVPDLSKTAKDVLHVGVAMVGSSKHSDMFSMMRPLSPEELAYEQRSIENVYENFVNNVAEGRDLTPAFVDSVAQGRVWTGADALKIGLVDEIGTLEDAIRYAAIAAGSSTGDLSDWNVAGYPKVPTTFELLMETFGQTSKEEKALAGTPFEALVKTFRNWDFKSSERIWARMPYEYQFR